MRLMQLKKPYLTFIEPCDNCHYRKEERRRYEENLAKAAQDYEEQKRQLLEDFKKEKESLVKAHNKEVC